MTDPNPTDPSINWIFGSVIASVVALLGYVVKSLVDKIGPAMERLTTAVEKIPSAVAEAIRDQERTRV